MKSFLMRNFCFLSACLLLSIGTIQAFNLSLSNAPNDAATSGVGWYDGTEWVSFETASVSEQKAIIEQVTTVTSIAAAIQSNGTGGGAWDQTSTWAGGIVPAAADVVTIDSGDVVTIPGITAEFSTLQVAEDAILNLHKSTQTGGSITNDGTIDIFLNGSNGDMFFNCDLTNNGTINWSGYNLKSTTGSTWTNNGVINVAIHQTITNIAISNENGGSFNKSSGNTITTTIPNFTNKAGGTISVSEGLSLTLQGTFSNAGTINSAGTLSFNNANCTFTGGTVSGSGFLNFQGTDTITATSGVTFAVDTMEQVNGNSLIGTAGTTMNIASGSTWRMLTSTRLSMETVTNNGTLDLYITAPNGDKRFDGTLINHGTIDWHNGHLTTIDGATWTNHGTMNMMIHSSITGIEFINETGGNFNKPSGGIVTTVPTSFTNKAGATITVADGLALTFQGTFSNAGTIDAVGTLSFTNINGTFTGGTIGGTGLLNFTGTDTITATSGVTFAVDTIEQTGTINGTAGSSMTIATGSTWRMITNARLAIPAVNNGKLDLYITNFNGNKHIDEDLTNNGTIDWSNGHLVGRLDTTTIFNAGIFNVNTTASITDICINTTATGSLNLNVNRTLPCFTNDGRFTIMSGNTYTVSDAGTYGGVCIVESGATLNITDNANDPIITGDTLVNDGMITLPAGRELIIGGTEGMQTVSGDGTITALGIDNPDNVSFPGNQAVTGTTRIYNGCIILETGNFSTDALEGTDSTRYIVTTGTGYLGCPAPAGVPTVFPVGPDTGIYSPVILEQAAGTGGAEFGVTVQVGLDNPVPTDSAYVNCEWDISVLSGTGNAGVTLQWNSPEDEVGDLDLNSNGICIYNAPNWVSLGTSIANCSNGTCTQMVTGQTSFGPFTVAGGSTSGSTGGGDSTLVINCPSDTTISTDIGLCSAGAPDLTGGATAMGGGNTSFTASTYSMGSFHGLAIADNGSLWAWGNDGWGQIGNGADGGSSTPIQVGTAINWTAVSAGEAFSLGLKSGGTLWSWGQNGNGQVGDGSTTDQFTVTQLGIATDWASISAGYSHSLALKTDGTLWAWGSNFSGQIGDGTTTDRTTPFQVGTATDWAFVSAGRYHSLAMKTDGTLWAWGSNSNGRLGTGGGNVTQPTQVGTATDWLTVSAGNSHNLGVKSDGTLWVWGWNLRSQLGDGTTTDRTVPTQNGTATDWKGVSAGSVHSVAYKTDGTIWSFGDNASGQLGNGSNTTSNVPVQVGTNTDWLSVTAGLNNCLALKSNGELWSWGRNQSGGLGNGTTSNSNVPVEVAGLTANDGTPSLTVTQMPAPGTPLAIGDNDITLSTMDAAGNTASCVVVVTVEDKTPPAITCPSDTIIYTDAGMCTAVAPDLTGAATVIDSCSVGGATSYTADTYSIGSFHGLAIADNGSLWAWGNDGWGQLGNGTDPGSGTPIQIGAATDWTAVSAGEAFSLGLKSDGTIWGWGQNGNGQVGDGTTTDQFTTTQIGTATDWASISAGHAHSLALKPDGTLWGWGRNTSGELGDGTNTSRTTPVQVGTSTDWAFISAGRYHSLAMKSDGTLWAWGSNSNGRLGTGGGNVTQPTQVGNSTDWTTVSAGNAHSLGVKSDGTLWVWGWNLYSQLGDGTTTNRTVPTQNGTGTDWGAVSAGSTHSIAYQTNGTVWAFGTNSNGQLGDGTNTTSNVPVQVGTNMDWLSVTTSFHSGLGLRSNGELWSWGRNQSGALGDGTSTSRNTPVQVAGLIVNDGSASLTVTQTPAPGTPLAIGDNNITLSTMDLAGNIDSCIVIVTVEDNIAPTFNCPSDMSLMLNVCNEFILTPELLGITVADNCDTMSTITLSQTIFTEPGITPITILVTDNAGNADSCTVNITFDANTETYTVTAGVDTDETCEETAIIITAASLLANDVASNNATLEIQELSLNNTGHGTLVDNMDNTWTFTPAANFTGNATFSYVVKSADASLYFDGTSHYYEYIVADQITWTAAETAAAARTLNGLSGYLATITSQAENDFITNKLQGYGWIGASDTEVEGAWKWVTGPEAGTLFWQGDASGIAVNGMYNNWVSVEPNNQNNEDYGHSGNNGMWNDWPNSIQWIDGYVVEYGGIDGCAPNFTATGTLTIAVTTCGGGDCDPNALTINDTPIPADTYHTAQTITSQGTTAVNTTVIFKAGQSITLQAGFHAVAGSEFSAIIEGCQATLVESETAKIVEQPSTQLTAEAPLATPSVKVFPNPTTYRANINLTLPIKETIQLDLFDLSGKRVANLVRDVTLPAGVHHYEWECNQVEAGMYLVVLNGRVVSRLAVVR